MVEEFRLPLGLARTASLVWLIVGDDDAVLGGFFSFLSQFVVVVV
jgi:hypothetical protein